MSLSCEIKGDNGYLIRIEVPDQSYHPQGKDLYEIFLDCRIQLVIPPFTGNFEMPIMPGEIADLAKELYKCYLELKGTVSFNPLECLLSFEIAFDKRSGKATIEGSAQHDANPEIMLEFEFDIDQKYLSATIAGLERIADRYPDPRTTGQVEA